MSNKIQYNKIDEVKIQFAKIIFYAYFTWPNLAMASSPRLTCHFKVPLMYVQVAESLVLGPLPVQPLTPQKKTNSVKIQVKDPKTKPFHKID